MTGQVTDWLRVRGGYSRAQRSPNIAELFHSPSQIFDPARSATSCSQRSTYRISANAGATGVTQRSCGGRAGGLLCGHGSHGRRQYGIGVTGGSRTSRSSLLPGVAAFFAWTNATGNPNLKPEMADTWTAGVVIQSPSGTTAPRGCV